MYPVASPANSVGGWNHSDLGASVGCTSDYTHTHIHTNTHINTHTHVNLLGTNRTDIAPACLLHNYYCQVRMVLSSGNDNLTIFVIPGFRLWVNISVLFWYFTRRRIVVSDRRFRTTYSFYFEGQDWLFKIGCPETSVRD